MAVQKKGLGRGLDALLDSFTPEQQQGSNQGVLEVNVRLIDTNAQQPRKQFDENALSDLSASIKTHGIVQPLIVTKRGDRYMIVAGERRFRAARMASLSTVPVIVTDFDEAEIHEVSLIENIQREDLNPIEEAAAIRFLMQQHDMTQEEVSGRIGKSRPAVANALRLLQLPEKVSEKIKEGVLSAGHGRAIAGVADKKTQEMLCDETLRMGYSVRALESRIQNLAEKKKEKPAKEKNVDSAVAYAEATLREKLGTRVTISGNEKRGKLSIDYYSKEELQGLFDLLNA